MNGLIIGMGEVGTALANNLQFVHDIQWYDPKSSLISIERMDVEGVDVLHICFPCDDPDIFRQSVLYYQGLCVPRFTVIHSTVFVGTSRLLNAYHSPVRGAHPNIAAAMHQFATYLGGPPNPELSRYFKDAGFRIHEVANPDETEAGKLWSLVQYGVSITLEKEIHAYCMQKGLDFDTIYSLFNRTYNEGYTAMGMPHVQRPIFQHRDGPIGGHCVIPALEKMKSESLLSWTTLLEGGHTPWNA